MAIELLNPEASQAIGSPLNLPVGRWTIVVGVEDNMESAEWQVGRLTEELAAATGLEIRRDSGAEPLWSALTAFPTLPIGEITISANLRSSDVAGYVAELTPGRWSIACHAANGIVRAHALAPEAEAIAPEIDRLRALAVRHGGNLTLLRCPTTLKTRLKVWGEPRPDWSICERIKSALDPSGVMNPGRFIGTI
ncbi:MAG: FAD-linked oxidase C-terminal domain-containing protein [Isosphaeraceae bacterium]